MKADKVILEAVVEVYADAICDVLNIATDEKFKFAAFDLENIDFKEGSYGCVIAPSRVMKQIAELGEPLEPDKWKTIILVGVIGDEIDLKLGIYRADENELAKIIKKAKKIIEELTICRLIQAFGEALAIELSKSINLDFNKN